MFGIHDFTLFVISSLIFIAAPGIDAMFVLSRGILNGRASGFAASFGVATGAFVHTILSTVGLSLILSQSVVLFTAIKMIGGVYLIYIGIKSLLKKNKGIHLKEVADIPLRKHYIQGVITNVANPKNILFYLSFLPQFATANSENGSIALLLLGSTFALLVLTWYTLVTIFSMFATKTIRDNRVFHIVLDKISGVVFIALGLKLLVTKPN